MVLGSDLIFGVTQQPIDVVFIKKNKRIKIGVKK